MVTKSSHYPLFFPNVHKICWSRVKMISYSIISRYVNTTVISYSKISVFVFPTPRIPEINPFLHPTPLLKINLGTVLSRDAVTRLYLAKHAECPLHFANKGGEHEETFFPGSVWYEKRSKALRLFCGQRHFPQTRGYKNSWCVAKLRDSKKYNVFIHVTLQTWYYGRGFDKNSKGLTEKRSYQ